MEMPENKLPENEYSNSNLLNDTKSCRLLMQNVKGFIGFWLDENLIPIFIDGAVRDMTGYNKEDFRTMRMRWPEIAIPEDQPLIIDYIERVKFDPNNSTHIEYRILRKDGEMRWVRAVIHVLPKRHGNQTLLMGSICDINELKLTEETLIRNEQARMKEMHHRIKNNLQVIYSLLSLQAEKFKDSKVIEAFRESQNRVASMALIHEELYKGNNGMSFDFAKYLKKLTVDLFSSYQLRNEKTSLKLNLEQICLSMDTAIPLGIIVNELVSNSLKYAFPSQSGGEINIILKKKGNCPSSLEQLEADTGIQDKKRLDYSLTVADNGIGIPEEIDFKNTESLGLQLVNILVEQIDGCINLKTDNGTRFIICFSNVEK